MLQSILVAGVGTSWAPESAWAAVKQSGYAGPADVRAVLRLPCERCAWLVQSAVPWRYAETLVFHLLYQHRAVWASFGRNKAVYYLNLRRDVDGTEDAPETERRDQGYLTTYEQVQSSSDERYAAFRKWEKSKFTIA